MNPVLAGLDIGGTKCAVVLGIEKDNEIQIVAKQTFSTPSRPEEALTRMMVELEKLMAEQKGLVLTAIGISCGGPLDSKRGLILSPPNLPNWNHIDVLTPLRDRFQVPVSIQNDANACALAEWKWGAGKGTRNMVFLTFGTGMGAGFILDGRLYTGTNDMAGEVGHVRLEQDGPIGYGKAGSFEGFCSGGGIARLAQMKVNEWFEKGKTTAICSSQEEIARITAKTVAEAAQAGDLLANQIYQIVGRKLGRGLALLVDFLNPEKIVIGSIYLRQEDLLKPIVMEELRNEALPYSFKVCTVVPSGLKEAVGDLASLSVAKYGLENEQ
ncbi:ROK family protein [Neobacillus vireti]|uniref:ROK family protein n=1 Tax=Neobacillus vireti LMG 21834 TaxID=1131730 RepID=A0AB94IKE9_9BACI|nr:ROK family protein [Neobacillus vireti]ETI67515.1 ROK family protein [Neobacillus vireti LMG 21834]KLT18522.1 ROK family transcriptional regulator [Neobacillus vireti]